MSRKPWGAVTYNPAEDQVINFQSHRPSRDEIEEQRRVADEIKRELAASKASEPVTAAPASAAAHDDELFWDYGAANNGSAAVSAPANPQVQLRARLHPPYSFAANGCLQKCLADSAMRSFAVTRFMT